MLPCWCGKYAQRDVQIDAIANASTVSPYVCAHVIWLIKRHVVLFVNWHCTCVRMHWFPADNRCAVARAFAKKCHAIWSSSSSSTTRTQAWTLTTWYLRWLNTSFTCTHVACSRVDKMGFVMSRVLDFALCVVSGALSAAREPGRACVCVHDISTTTCACVRATRTHRIQTHT